MTIRVTKYKPLVEDPPMVSVGTKFGAQAQMYGILVQKAQYNEFCRVWVKELGLDELSNSLHGVKKQSNTNKSYYDQRIFRPKRPKFNV